MEIYDPSQSGNYYILGDSNTEMVHLIEQDRNFNTSMGGLFPEQSKEYLSSIHHVLDIACGPGGWALEVAQAYPHMQVTGVDISAGMVDYATVQAHASGLDNVSFKVGNIAEPLDFANESFDLVNARHIEEVIPVTAFAPLFKEMFRISRHDGTIRITGSEWGVTNSPAYETLMERLLRASRIAELDFSADGRNIGISPWLHRFLRDAGCVNVQEKPSFLDCSAGAKLHQSGYRDLTLAFELMRPFLIGVGVAAPEEFDQLLRQLSLEMLEESFR